MRKLIVANWKLNPATLLEAKRLFDSVSKSARRLKSVETVLCPPFVWLTDLPHKFAKEVSWGTQDVFWEGEGAYTGEISPKMLKTSKVSYVIIGHSERRRHLGETDEMVNKKVLASLKNGLRVILCVGENLQEHKSYQTKLVLRRQLRKALNDIWKLKIGNWKLRNHLVIAYEPIWAIGTGMPETPFSANEAAKSIRKELLKLLPDRIAKNVRIIYGGSVNSKNIFGYLVMSEITGALVGGASLDAKDFVKILAIADLL